VLIHPFTFDGCCECFFGNYEVGLQEIIVNNEAKKLFKNIFYFMLEK
jgi:hypothetical protein